MHGVNKLKIVLPSQLYLKRTVKFAEYSVGLDSHRIGDLTRDLPNTKQECCALKGKIIVLDAELFIWGGGRG
jgi:hypothetical protein